MERFSSAVLQLYENAQSAGGASFLDGALATLAELVGFGAATLTRYDQRASDDFEYVHEFVQQAGPNYICPAQRESLRDAALHGMRCGHQRPLTLCLRDGQQALVVASDTPECLPPYCMILRRSSDCSFDRYQITLVMEWWRHFRIAHALSLHHALGRQHTAETQRTMAVVTGHGAIEYADSGFTALLRSEWDMLGKAVIPGPLWSALNSRREVYGKRVLLRLCVANGDLICEARALPAVSCLGPKERFVAMRLAQGDDYKRIARQLGTSPNTVRSQISCIYRKLHVHNRVDLAGLILGPRWAASPLLASLGSDSIEGRDEQAGLRQVSLTSGIWRSADFFYREPN